MDQGLPNSSFGNWVVPCSALAIGLTVRRHSKIAQSDLAFASSAMLAKGAIGEVILTSNVCPMRILAEKLKKARLGDGLSASQDYTGQLLAV